MLLALLFFVTALLYACAGFGGGSTYNALLVLAETDYRLLPFIALSCNIIVVSGGVWHFSKRGHLRIREVLPWIAFSVPAAFIGGYIPVSETVFTGLLGTALLLSGLRMLWPETAHPRPDIIKHRAGFAFMPSFLGGALGLLAGLTGIGGGIFLAPVLHFLRWGNPKNIAGICSLFILVNSVAGLIGHTARLGQMQILGSVFDYWMLFPAVLAGGQLGSWLSSSKIDVKIVKKLTAVLILYVAARLLLRFGAIL